MMIYLFFFLKFKAQLRRTRPEIIRQIDESLTRSVVDAGGKITGDRFVISAVFNEGIIGFWLDIFILIEKLYKNIEASSELFGFSLVISSKMPDNPEMLCRFLGNHSGVFVNDAAARKLIPYAVFEKPAEWLKRIKRRKYGCGSYYRIKELRNFKKFETNESVIRNDVAKLFENETGKNTLVKNTLVLGSAFSQLHSGLFLYCGKINKDFPPLTICFGSAGIGALVDIWSPGIRSIDAEFSTEKIDKLWEFLFRERLRDEVSEYVVNCVMNFIILVLDYYCRAAKKKKRIPILAL
ncbi:MAG: hypothetical protein LBU66_05995, partial [Treponema sp.]|nr:hypothetical protein [Treponema sp.]